MNPTHLLLATATLRCAEDPPENSRLMPTRNPITTQPPDDTGSDTLRRFRYQAKVAFPYVLNCGTGGDVVAVVPEHYEDVAIQYVNGWRLGQIKSRDPSQGLWTLGGLTARKGGALRSLYRSYTAMADTEATYDLLLELPVSPYSSIHRLTKSPAREVPGLIAEVAKALKIDEEQADGFMARVRLREPLPTRAHIDAVNRALLLANAPHVAGIELERIYAAALNKVEAAMRAEPVGIPWPRYLALRARGRQETVLSAKTLSREVCEGLFAELTKPPSRLLRKLVDPTAPRPTTLESKLVLGGATDAMVDSAIRLRAHAATAAYEAECAPQSSRSAELEDLKERLYHRVTALVEKHCMADAPAPAIWDELMAVSAAEAATLDPNGVADRDPMLLVGHVCELSDECRTGWGGRDA